MIHRQLQPVWLSRAVPVAGLLFLTGIAFILERYPLLAFYGYGLPATGVLLLIMLRIFGFTRGVLATLAVVIGGLAFGDMNAARALPLAVTIVMTGFLLRRSPNNLIMHTAMSWLVLGFPLTMIIYWLDTGHSDYYALLYGLLAVLAGLMTSLVADVLLSYTPWLRRLVRKEKLLFSFRQMMLHLVLIAIMMPYLSYTAIEVRNEDRLLQKEAAEQLTSHALSLRADIHGWSDEDIHALTQFGMTPDGWTSSIASRLTSSKPAGIVLLDSRDRMLLLLGDRWMSTQTAQRWREAEPFGTTGLSAWTAGERNATEQWRRGYFVVERSIDIRGHQMTVIAGAPLSVYLSGLVTLSISHILLLLIFTFISMLLTRLLAAMFFRNFDKLAAVTTGLSERISRNQPVDWPASNIYEINQLTYNFRVVTDKLGIIFQQIKMANDQLLRQKEQLAASEERLHWLAYYDNLTGLPNRLQLKEKLEQLLAEPPPGRDIRLAVIFIDLDRFKQVNDTLGHSAGDELLQHVSSRLSQFRSDQNSVFRLGGDEFAIVAADAEAAEAAQLAQRIATLLSAPIQLDRVSFYMTTSIGIAVYPGMRGDADSLLKYAESAMYAAKERGGNGSMFYAEEMNARLSRRTWVENNLHLALEQEEFMLYYQLKVDSETGQPVGMEALVRWQHPERGVIPPSDFIPIAEETGFIIPLGDWILREACAQNRRWQLAGLPPLRIAVNLSARQFYNPKLVDTVRKVLEEVGMEPQYLELEVTEGYLVNEPEYVVSLLRELADMGVYVSIDDFGTGYSSLGQLKHYPVHAVKIDQTFVRDIDTNHSNESIVRAMIQLAHSMNLQVVAEGVETEEERSILCKYGSDALQGYLFSKPVPAPMFEQLLRTEV